MLQEAEKFMTTAGLLYEGNRVKWKSMLKKQGLKFNDDIFNDSIIKTYDAILKKEIDKDYVGYWYRTFLNNTRRDTKYAYHNRDEDVDVFEYMSSMPYEEYNDRTGDVEKIVCTLSDKELILMRMHYELKIPYEVIEEMTGVKDVRRIMKKILDRVGKQGCK